MVFIVFHSTVNSFLCNIIHLTLLYIEQNVWLVVIYYVLKL